MESQQVQFEAIGTTWTIDLFDVDGKNKQEISQTVIKRIAEFDEIYSRFNPASLIRTIAQKKGTYQFPADAKPLFEIYHKLYQITGGLFTPLIGKTLEEAGYDKDYSLHPKILHHPPAWEAAIDYKHPQLTVKKPVLLDIGAAGKGYLIDLVAKLLKQKKINSFCIDAGGDMLYKNPTGKKLRVGLENPTNTAQVIGVLEMSNQAICASAGNRRQWGKFHHIINPVTLTSPDTILATWVIADTTIIADAIATCLFFTSPKLLQKHFDFEYLILFPDYTIQKSFAFPAELFYNKTG